MRGAVLLAFCLAAFSPALADERTDAVSEIIACGEVRGDKARRQCFERSLPALRQAFPEALELAESRAQAARLAAKEEAKEEFGLPAAVARANDPYEEGEFGAESMPRDARQDEDDDDDVDSIEASVVEVARTLRGKIVVILDNGQVWRQIDADSSDPYIPHKTDGLTARVKRGAFGSYSVRLSSDRESFKARRMK